MSLPSQSIRVLDPGLGFVNVSGDAPLKVGVCSAGVVGTLYSFSQPSTIRATLGYGDLADEVAKTLAERGAPVLAIRTTGSTAATSSAVVKNGTGTPTPTIAGTPTMRLSTVVTVKVGGALGVAQFVFSHDNWQPSVVTPSTSQQRPVPAGGTFLFPNTGITMTFPSGTYVAGDTYSFTTEPAHSSAADVAAAVASLLATPNASPNVCHLTDTFTTATEAATVATAVGAQAQAMAAAFRYSGWFVDFGSADTAANTKTSRATFSDVRVCPFYGFELVAALLPFEGYGFRYASICGSAAARAARVVPSTDLARFAEGSLTGTAWIAFDSNVDGSVDAAGISTARTWPNTVGFYIANGNMAAPTGSDFQYWQFRRLMDIACESTYVAMLPFIAEDLRTTSAGTLDPKEAAVVDTAGQEAMNDSLMRPKNARGKPGLVSAVAFASDQTNNLNTTSTLQTNIGIRPRGYARNISQTIGYSLAVGA